ncbi:hypothetical protein N431DRAFT_430269 [Stipitochalara longipes BDJ]|nr:hypothetical protein N431DRAFT_430269 [Stipitochalara longipes BDJ]
MVFNVLKRKETGTPGAVKIRGAVLGLQCTTTQGIFRKRRTLRARMFLESRDIR